jgi:hypothetical protein
LEFWSPVRNLTSGNWEHSDKGLSTFKFDIILTITIRIAYHHLKVDINH